MLIALKLLSEIRGNQRHQRFYSRKSQGPQKVSTVRTIPNHFKLILYCALFNLLFEYSARGVKQFIHRPSFVRGREAYTALFLALSMKQKLAALTSLYGRDGRDMDAGERRVAGEAAVDAILADIANEQAAVGKEVLFVVVPDLLDHLRATFNPASQVRFDKRFDQVRDAPLLILDDLGTQSSTPWAQEKLFQLLNHRYNARLPTVVTTSQEIEEIDPRLRTRMLDRERCTIWVIGVPGYRSKKKGS